MPKKKMPAAKRARGRASAVPAARIEEEHKAFRREINDIRRELSELKRKMEPAAEV